MSTRGRPQKEIPADLVESRVLAGKRLAVWRKGRGLTQGELAEKFGNTPLTIGRYERGEQGVSERMAKWLEKESGIFWRYWTGETEYTTQADYMAAMEQAAWESESEYQKEEEERTARLETLFSLCGYRYEENSREADFFDLIAPAGDTKIPPGRHKVTPYLEPTESFQFTDEELAALLEDLGDTISYHWHRKVQRHKRETENK